MGIHLYRIVQEALNNVCRHAKARNVRVRLKKHHRTLELAIEDDGSGFARSSLESRKKSTKGLGLINIQERAGLLSGAARFISSPAKGTREIVRVPLA